ncbi:MAG: LamG domain-containing protein, partial [Planctomycetota bacterium]
ATYNGSVAKIYINGQETGSYNTSGLIPSTSSPLLIGAHNKISDRNPFNGIMDEVAIFNRALTAEEIQAGMYTKLAGDEPNLVGYWDFDEGEGQFAYDLSSNGNDGVLGRRLGPDGSDPNWVDSDAPVGICSLEEIVERNLLNVLGMKTDVLDILDEAIGKEEALWEYMDIVFKDQDFGNASKSDVVKAKQKIHSAIKHEEQAETAVDQSIDKLDDALDTLGIE